MLMTNLKGPMQQDCCTVSVLFKYFLDDIEFAGPESVCRPVDGICMIELLSHLDGVWLAAFAW
jgi:hypothetical protein